MTFEEYAIAHDLYFTEDYESDEFQIAREAWDAAQDQDLSDAYMAGLKDASSRKLPEGYVLVPVEPTEKMVEAAYEIDMEVKYDRKGNYLHAESTSVRRYKAMIQTAQEEE